jgi:hypothetical protein
MATPVTTDVLNASLQQLGAGIANALSQLNKKLDAIEQKLISMEVRTAAIERSASDTTAQLSKVSAASPSRAGGAGGKTSMSVNYRFAHMAKEAHKDTVLRDQWMLYMTGQFADRYNKAKELVDLADKDKKLDESTKNGQIATQMWRLLSEAESSQFKQWSEGDAVKHHWVKKDSSTHPATTDATTPAQLTQSFAMTNFGMGTPAPSVPATSAAPAFDASRVLGGADGQFGFRA